MLEILFAIVVLAAGLTILAIALRRARAARRTSERLESAAELPGAAAEEPPAARPMLVRRRWLPWIVGLAAMAAMHWGLGWSLPFVLSAGLIVSLLGGQLESHLAARASAKIEVQLADAIDLMVGALGAGASVADAMENAMRESRAPLQSQLEDVIGRIRLGDNPPAVYRGLAQRVPLETFLLFSSALAVQWETGGSLAPTLAGVGRTIRDRIDISRRIRSNSAQSDVSTVAVMLLTYFIALIMWRSNPEQMAKFLATAVGQWCVAGTVLLQAFGLAWMSVVSRLRF
jgi:Flp pilus assembly protein TadB